tara:strand:- start:1915 stop:2289 length:375 start_codon:yes stop_codon:yes gene_type:complete
MVGLPSKRYISLAYKVLAASDKPLNTIQIQDGIIKIQTRAVRKGSALGIAQLASHMQRSGLFTSIGKEKVLSAVGHYSKVNIWEANDLTEVAKKWMSYESPVRTFEKLPSILKNEIKRIKEETE